MAYRQYTTCVDPGNYVDLSFNAIGIRNILIILSSALAIAWVGSVILGGPGAIIVGISLMTAVVAYLYWWLNGRLICLGGERCLIGVIEGLGPSDPLTKSGDNDFTMNVFLAPGPTAIDDNPCLFWFPQACNNNEGNFLQGDLVQPNPAILAIGRGYDQGSDKKYQEFMHCEFEGDGVHTMLLYSEAVLALLIAALIATLLASALGPLFVLFAIFLFLVGLVTKILFPGPGAAGAGDPGDLSPSPGELGEGDIVVVRGDWVYDSLHPGWNEIHAVHACQKCSGKKLKLPSSWPPEFTGAQLVAMQQKWCSAIAGAEGAETGGSRQDPQNDWVIHPLVDGCTPIVLV